MARILFFFAIVLLVVWLLAILFNFSWRLNRKAAEPQKLPASAEAEKSFYRYKRKYFLNSAELTCYNQLQQALVDYVVYPRLALSMILTADEYAAEATQRALVEIDEQQIDFAVFDKRFNLLVAINLDDQVKPNSIAAEKKAAILNTVGIASLNYDSKNLPDAAQIMRDFVRLQANAREIVIDTSK